VTLQRLRVCALLALGGAICLWIGLRPTVTMVDRNHDGRPDRFTYIVAGTLRASGRTLVANLPSQHGSSLIDPFERETTVRCEIRKLESPAGLMSSSKLYGLAPCRGSPSVSTPVRIVTIPGSSSQFDSGRLVSRGPPASDSAL
jgi:hypothetical protein